MKERQLFLNTYYFNMSQEKERNRSILDNFYFNTDYNDFNINSYVIALSLFTDQKNYRNDTFNINDYEFLNNILEDFFKGNNSNYNINRDQLKTIIDLCNSNRLSIEDNEKIIKEYINRNKEYQKQLDILLEINKQV